MNPLDAALILQFTAGLLESIPPATPTPTPTTTATATDTPAVTATPTKQPDGDTDGDGCTDTEENGPDERFGGRRDYLNPYDFFDVPLPPGNPEDPSMPKGTRDGVINIFDVLGVQAKVGTHDNGTPDDFSDDPPNAGGQKYNPDFDRTLKGPGAWNSGPPNGAINNFDVLQVLAQVGHSCLGG